MMKFRLKKSVQNSKRNKEKNFYEFDTVDEVPSNNPDAEAI